MAHYLEHLLFKGTDKYGSLDWAKEKPKLDSIDALYEVYGSTTDPEKEKKFTSKLMLFRAGHRNTLLLTSMIK
ncbi:hypothetical protein LWM68_42280 [Niabella sp. W65]|nr:hypothetical protein [Niabella sp. W65]MCH7368780.1 hypothetical protein [Niabella sp. W65]ULT44356.1 hypothetical protein KRR40_13980 [Niabella sp. I65]